MVEQVPCILFRQWRHNEADRGCILEPVSYSAINMASELRTAYNDQLHCCIFAGHPGEKLKESEGSGRKCFGLICNEHHPALM